MCLWRTSDEERGGAETETDQHYQDASDTDELGEQEADAVLGGGACATDAFGIVADVAELIGQPRSPLGGTASQTLQCLRLTPETRGHDLRLPAAAAPE